MPTRMRGFSLYELLVTIAIASTVLALGVPSFGSLVARNRQSVEINALFHAVHLARKESIMRRRVVSLCPSSDGLRCTPGRDWSAGWLMFENADRDEPPQVDDGEPVLVVHRVDPAIRLTANRRGFTFRATFKRATNGTFVACDIAARAVPKALVVSYTGRPRVAVETSRGERYRCPD
ncbi:MAG: GspH/FimT family pseudopilin [Woeseiaceae bacterium]|nr:GspH/FimT family pseudopilin [Woeseiaceae bacterium]